ncbi:MAG TPA: zf-TFIIB domain-containing protein [Verrucomicrobiota bacterium]|nr:zf-TFIIB domain-containing protein [Verrucomicrobiota bacterium]
MSLCPRDGQTLASNDVSGYRYYSCERCRGYWIPGGALHRVLSARGVSELRSVPRAGKGDIDCPDCHRPSVAVVIAGCRLDFCANCHGVWLDSGEVNRVRSLFPEGSAVVDADASRVSKGTGDNLGTLPVVEFVGDLFLFLIP